MNKPLSQEIKFVGLVIAVVLAVTSIPYAYGYLSSPQDQQFMGVVLNVGDHWQYFSWMREFSNSILAENRLTAEPGKAVFFNLQWLLLGISSKYLDLDYPQTYEIFRWMSTIVFLLTAYYFCGLFLQDRRMRKTAFLVITLTSGFGWILVALKQLTGELLFPMTVYITEANTFLCIMAYPHFTISAFLMLIIFSLVLAGHERKGLIYAVVAGSVSLILGFVHGFDLITVYGVLIVFGCLLALKEGASKHLIKSVFLVISISCPAVVYSILITRTDPIWKQVLVQYNNASVWTPNPFQLIILMGPIFLIALFTFTGVVPLRQSGNRELFLKAWFGTSFFLIYLPVNFQIHLLNGWQIPMAILATIGLFKHIVPDVANRSFLGMARRLGIPTDKERLATVLATGLILAVLPTNIYLTAWRVVDLDRHQYPYYLHRDELAALNWLEHNSFPSDVVISSQTIGQYIPSMSGNRAFLAHVAQTMHFFQKREMVNLYFSETTPEDQRIEIIRRYNIGYVFYGGQERALGRYDPDDSPYLQKVFSKGKVSVYKVHLESLTLATE